jgi:hypothetical protein
MRGLAPVVLLLLTGTAWADTWDFKAMREQQKKQAQEAMDKERELRKQRGLKVGEKAEPKKPEEKKQQDRQ